MSRIRQVLRTISRLTLGVCLVLTPFVRTNALQPESQDAATSESELKAAYLWNFARFVEWPQQSFSDNSIRLCVLGDDELTHSLGSAVANRRIAGRSVEVRPVYRFANIAGCHLLYVGSGTDSAKALAHAEGASTLTVGEGERFVSHGGMIGFVLEHDRLRFHINLFAARRVRLNISSRLLSLALTVRE